MCERTIIRPCTLGNYTCVAGRRRFDGVQFFALGFKGKDTIEELDVAASSRQLIDLNQEVTVVDGEGEDYFKILVPGHPSRHPDFRIEVTGEAHMEVEILRHVMLARLGLQLPEQVLRIEPRRNMDIFHFDGQLATLSPIVAGDFRYTPAQVRAAFGEEL